MEDTDTERGSTPDDAKRTGRRAFLTGLGAVGLLGMYGPSESGQGAQGQNQATTTPQGQTTTPEQNQTTTPERDRDTTTPERDRGTTLEDAQSAVIRVDTQGAFVPPGEIGSESSPVVPGGGSGFIVDPSGIAVTTNHVVTGAATIEVVLADDPNRTYNARILGASECTDLAVIQLAGSDFSALEWADSGSIQPLTEVFSLGFPVSAGVDAFRYTVTRGIISQTDADGETQWASVDSVIQHDARINPGSSGGPLVTRDGRVVGVNYAGIWELDLNFAIGSDLAQQTVSILREGENHEWIGINGQAILSEDGTLSGIWVSSVASGSPADDAGIVPGDLVTVMEGLPLAQDGTMADYCDVLRSHGPGDELKVEVLRIQTDELLVGEINGDPLEPMAVVEEDGPAPPEEFQTVRDDSGLIRVEVPASWSDVRTGGFEGGDPGLSVSPDVDDYISTWGTPGFSARIRRDANPDDLEAALEQEVGEVSNVEEACTDAGTSPFDNAFLTGVQRRFDACSDARSTNIYVAARPVDGRPVVMTANAQLVTIEDTDAFGRIVASLQVGESEETETIPTETTPTETAQAETTQARVERAEISYPSALRWVGSGSPIE